ncbi:MAG TPA: hypothetical protein VEZ70_09210 [Allosphingosinicella sp.]|nr:hypothetical protein [Allosphingosinicella sp.]
MVRETGEGRLLVAALAAYGVLGMLPLTISPVLVNVVEHHAKLGSAYSGLVASAALISVTMGALAGSLVVHRISFRRLAGIGGCLLAASQIILIALASSRAALIPTWMLAGFGAGLALAAGGGLITRSANAAAFAAKVSVLASLAGIVILPMSGLLTTYLGPKGLSLALLATVALVWLGVRQLAPTEPSGRPDLTPGVFGGNRFARAILLLTAASVWTRDGMVWSFSAVLGLRVGVSEASMSAIFFAVGLSGMAGSAVTAWFVSTRTEMGAALIGGALVSGSLSLLWVTAAGPAAFATLQIAYNASQFFLVPLYLGLAALLDRTGRLAAAVGAVSLAGAAIGPAAAGVLLERSGGEGLLAGLAFMLVLTLVLHLLLAGALRSGKLAGDADPAPVSALGVS